jgi:streptogramin lyase
VAWEEDTEGASVLRLAPTPDAGYSYRPFDGWAGLDELFQPESIEVTPEGSAWLLGADRGEVRLLRFDDQGWEVVDAPTSLLDHSSPRVLAAGPDGSLWLVGGDWNTSGGQRRFALARLGSDGWSTYEVMDAGIGWGQSLGSFANNLVVGVAPDGALWLNASGENVGDHAGVARFDGASWQRFLDGHSVHDLDVGPDGAVWVRASHGELPGAVESYVITPEAVAATE